MITSEQLNAGFIIEHVKKLIEITYPIKSQQLLKYLSSFELETYQPIPNSDFDHMSILAVASNLISRGLPTRMSYNLEKVFVEKFDYLEEYKVLGGKYFKLKFPDAIKEKCWQALHIIDKRINRNNARLDYENSFENLGSIYEENFLLKNVPNILGDYFIQLLESQRSLNQIIRLDDDSDIFRNLENYFKEQRVDFSIQFPYNLTNFNRNGIVVEIDGSQHQNPQQNILDQQRNNAADLCNWETIRIPTNQFNNLKTNLNQLRTINQNEDYFQIVKSNYYDKELTGEWLDILQLVLSPFGIARIQKVLIELIMRGILNIQDRNWNICIIERDMPCGHLAIKDFQEFINNLFELESKEKRLPEIKLKVYSSKEFIDSKLNQDFRNEINLLGNTIFDSTHYNIVLDVSVLQRSRLSPKLTFGFQPDHYFKIRSSHSVHSNRTVYSTDLIEYSEIVEKETDGNYKPIPKFEKILEYFLINIFRKEKFRVGQLPILSRTLSLKSVIGLLPTGGGKSLTYQLSSLLQPGITVIVDPIKSLMKDQVDGLNKNLIDFSEYLNSSKKGQNKLETHKLISKAQALFVFISPERMQMDEFRKILESLVIRNYHFSYCVIDEAHCVSEWGHDFRTSYLQLGVNANNYCKTRNQKPITILGLTATASFDVLADILREISNTDNQLDSDAIVRFETTNRPEIQYEMIETNIADPANNNILNIKNLLGTHKQVKLNELLSEISNKIYSYNDISKAEEIFNDAYINDPLRQKIYGDFDLDNEFKRIKIGNFSANDFYNPNCQNAGIVFCPNKSWVLGVTDIYYHPGRNLGVYDNVANNIINKGTFIGVDNENQIIANIIEMENEINQNAFLNNQLHLMVCTKAFGMGIDKPNVRFSVHINYPQSIESFIQESGRIGRDGELAIALILYNEQIFNTNIGNVEIDKSILEDFHSKSFRGQLKEKLTIQELLQIITYPKKTNVHLLNDYLEDEGYDAYTNYWTNNNGIHLLFINQALGYINLNNLNSNYNGVNNLIYAQEIHSIIRGYCNENKPQNINLITWLNTLNQARQIDGIEVILDQEGSFDVTLGFNNDWDQIFSDMSTFLTGLGIQRSVVEIRDANGFGRNRETKISKFCQALHINLNDDNQSRLEKIFLRIRDKQDTEKAIYRLSILGIIDKYEVDYRTHTFKIEGIKKTHTEIKKKIREYLKKYYSEQRVEQEIAKIPGYPTTDENNYLHKCIAYLIDFVYKEIAEDRKRAIGDMKAAIRQYLNAKNNPNEKRHPNIEVKDYFYYYFNAKYARQGYEESFEGIIVNQSLADRIDDGSDDTDLVYEFIKYAAADINNFRHLRGACIRLISQKLENASKFSLYLLKAYAVFVIEQNILTLLEDGVKDFLRGLELYYEKIKYDNVSFISFVDKFIDLIQSQTNLPVADYIRDAVNASKLYAHNNWLIQINKELRIENARRKSTSNSN